MQDLTENILSDCKGSCGIVRIADALATNDQLKDTHVDKPRSTSRYGRILEACNLIKIDKGLALRYQVRDGVFVLGDHLFFDCIVMPAVD